MPRIEKQTVYLFRILQYYHQNIDKVSLETGLSIKKKHWGTILTRNRNMSVICIMLVL